MDFLHTFIHAVINVFNYMYITEYLQYVFKAINGIAQYCHHMRCLQDQGSSIESEQL